MRGLAGRAVNPPMLQPSANPFPYGNPGLKTQVPRAGSGHHAVNRRAQFFKRKWLGEDKIHASARLAVVLEVFRKRRGQNDALAGPAPSDMGDELVASHFGHEIIRDD